MRSGPVAAHAELPVLDNASYQLTASLFPASDLHIHLWSLIGRADGLVESLRAPRMLTKLADIAAAAHALGGAASPFGFRRLADAAGRFERAADADAMDVAEQAEHLVDATEASVKALRSLVEAAPAMNRTCAVRHA